MNEFKYRRLPASRRKISDISPEKDIRIRILGKVLDKTDSTVIIDDGSGKAEIFVDELPDNDFVQVFARVLPLEDGYELRAEAVQDMDKLDIDLHKKIFQ
jgi:hypothetical protein